MNIQQLEAHNKKLQDLFDKLQIKKELLTKLKNTKGGVETRFKRYVDTGKGLQQYDTSYVYAPYQPLYFSSP
jgi:hypothetical protein